MGDSALWYVQLLNITCEVFVYNCTLAAFFETTIKEFEFQNF